MATTAELTARLAAAETALHDLTTGNKPVKVDVGDGKTVTYTATDQSALRAYIAELQSQLDPPGSKPRRRPLKVFF